MAPEWLATTTSLASNWMAMCPAPYTTAEVIGCSPGARNEPCGCGRLSRNSSSVANATSFMMRTASRGYWPMAVSPESMQASPPSRIALATSVTSARVGRRECCMLSSICVAMITGFCWARQADTIRFCTTGICATSISTPKSPRATMIASDSSMMLSNWSRASGFSILATTRADDPLDRSSSFNSHTSSLWRTKLRPTKSISCSAAHSAFSRSSSSMAGALSFTPGRLSPWRLRISPGCVTSQTATSGPFSTTFMPTVPSASITVSPMCQFVDQRLVGRDQLVHGRGFAAADEAVAGAGFALDRVAGQLAQANLGTGQIREHGNRLPQQPARLANHFQRFEMHRTAGMGHVQAEDVGPGSNQVHQPVDTAAGRADGGNDLRTSALQPSSVSHAFSRQSRRVAKISQRSARSNAWPQPTESDPI